MRAINRPFAMILLFAALLQGAGCDSFVSPEARVERAKEQIEKGDRRTAALELRNALKKRPDLATARILLADVALWLGDVRGADDELHRASPQVDAVQYADIEARVDLAMGRQQKLLDRLSAGGSALDASTQELYRGLALLDLKRPEEAGESLRKVLQADPKRIEARVALAESMAARNDFDEALRITGEAVKSQPDAALAWFVHGALLAYRRETSAAADALQRAVDLAPRQLDVPRQVSLLSTLIDMRLLAGDVERARAASGMLDRLLPGSTTATMMSSRVAMAANDFTTAASQLRKIVNAVPDDVPARFLLAVALMSQGHLEQASAELNEVVQRAPENLEARQLLGRVRLQLQDPDGAMRALVPALQSGTDDVQLTSLFDAARAQSGGEQSIPLLEKALAGKPENGALQIQLASAYMQAGAADKARALLTSKSDEPNDSRRFALLLESIGRSQGVPAAVAEAERAVAAQPTDVRTRQDVAAFYLRTGQMAKATAHLEAARQQSADAVEPRLLLARIALAANDPKRADALVAEILKVGSAKVGVLNRIGMLYLTAGRFDRAVEHFRAGVDLEPSSAPMWLNLGRAQAALGQAGPARKAVEKALELQPKWVPAEGVLVFMDLQAGAREAAVKRIDTLKAVSAKDPSVHVLDAEAQLALRDFGKAAAAFEAAYKLQPSGALANKMFQTKEAGKLPAPTQPLESWLRQHPDDMTIRNILADAYLRAGNKAGAMEQYEKILARQSRNAPALNNLAWLYYEGKDLPKALDFARRAVSAAPRSPAVSDTLGWILVESGRIEEGLPILKDAAEHPGTVADIRYHYAAGLARAGSNAEARTRLERLLSEEAKFSTREAAEQLLRELGSAREKGGEG